MMANGKDGNDKLSVTVRPGLKREFQFALRARSEVCSESSVMGRTRSSRFAIGSVPALPPKKRSKVVSSTTPKTRRRRGLLDEEAKSDVVDVGSGDESEAIVSVSKPGKNCMDSSPHVTLVKIESGEKQPFRRFTRSALKNANCCAVEPAKEAKKVKRMVRKRVPHAVEGDVGEPCDSLLDSCGVEEPQCSISLLQPAKSDVMELGLSEEVANTGAIICVPMSGSPIPFPNSVEDCGMEKQQPLKRFTRSAMKEKSEAEKGKLENGNGAAEQVANGEDSVLPLAIIQQGNNIERKFILRLKHLLDSGVLEGAKVKYCRGTKAIASGKSILEGVIKGSDILCFCHSCRGQSVVSPTVFELHAGSLNKRPSDFIFLENGNSLRDVINCWKTASVEIMDEMLRVSIGCMHLKKPNFCFNCKGPMIGTRESVVCEACLIANEYLVSSSVPQITNGERFVDRITSVALATRAIKSSATKPRSQGKVTRKDIRLHKLVFEEDVLPDGTEVAYCAKGKRLLMGYKKGFGIVCSCCNTEVSPSVFEAHAGWAARRKPYSHIYTSNGVSLHELAISLCKSRKISTFENDDLCQICQDGGALICCDGCPRSFHEECLVLPVNPVGEFFCKYCQNAHHIENGVESNSNAKAAGRVDGVDVIDQINRRCIRIVKVPGTDFGGCSICRDPDFDKEFGPRTIILCDQCEKEYHVGCLRDRNMEDLKELPSDKWFCCEECNAIHTALQKLVLNGEEKLLDSSFDLIKKKLEGNSGDCEGSANVRWRLLSGQRDPNDKEGLLSAAVSIFHEQFSPIIHKLEHDLIPAMVKGETLMENEFTGMYCAVLLVNGAIVSSAIIRIFGPEVAELPLVATASHCQGKGYFQALFSCLENLLTSLNVKDMVLPAAEEAESIWTNKFGFQKITQDELLEYRKFHELMIFEGTSVLRKSVPNKCL